MHTASQTEHPATPHPIETAADARNAISELTAVMDGLEAVVARRPSWSAPASCARPAAWVSRSPSFPAATSRRWSG